MSGHEADIAGGPSRASSGLMHRSKAASIFAVSDEQTYAA